MIPEGTPANEIVIVLFVVVVIAVSGLWALFYFTRPLPPKSEAPAAPPAAPPIRSRPLDQAPARPSIGDVIMSRLQGSAGPIESGARGLAASPAEGLQPVAMPCKGANVGLARQALDDHAANGLDDITPAEARAIIRQQARAEAIVAILKAAENGKVKSAGDQAGLIEAVSGASRTSRAGSPYTALKAVVDDLRGKNGPRYPELDEQHRAMGVMPEKI